MSPSSLPASCLFCLCSCSSSCLSFSSSFFRILASSYLVEKWGQDVFYCNNHEKQRSFCHVTLAPCLGTYFLSPIEIRCSHCSWQATTCQSALCRFISNCPKTLKRKLYVLKLKLFSAFSCCFPSHYFPPFNDSNLLQFPFERTYNPKILVQTTANKWKDLKLKRQRR